MGWAYGRNGEGREIGYGVEAQCDEPGCDAQIDRGLAYVCGAMHDGGEYGCGRYFCASHLTYAAFDDDNLSPQVCGECCKRIEAEPETQLKGK